MNILCCSKECSQTKIVIRLGHWYCLECKSRFNNNNNNNRLRYAPCGASYTVHTDSFTAHNNNNNNNDDDDDD